MRRAEAPFLANRRPVIFVPAKKEAEALRVDNVEVRAKLKNLII